MIYLDFNLNVMPDPTALERSFQGEPFLEDSEPTEDVKEVFEFYNTSVDVTPKEFPYLTKYTHRLRQMKMMPVGRDLELRAIASVFKKQDMKNVALLANAGAGKTALAEAYAYLHRVDGVLVYEMRLSDMASDGSEKFAERINGVVEDVLKLVEKRIEVGEVKPKFNEFAQVEAMDVVLFIDEMHMLTQREVDAGSIGSNASNALKPLMTAGSIKLLAATTEFEYYKYIAPDNAFDTRFEIIRLRELTDEQVVDILRNFVKNIDEKTYEGLEDRVDDNVYAEIVDYTNRYYPADSQPRKSLRLLDRAIGDFRISRDYDHNENARIDHELIRAIIKQSRNIDVDFRANVSQLLKHLPTRVAGQDGAIASLKRVLYNATAGIRQFNRPAGVLMFAGPTGVGKTELSLALAEGLFGSESAMVRFDMSEFSNAEDVKKFQFALARKLGQTPYCVLLLDELEKANDEIHALLLGVLDAGRLSDEHGRQIPCNNCLVICTTNAGQNVFRNSKNYQVTVDETRQKLLDALGDVFRAEFLGRFDEIVLFSSLEQEDFSKITMVHLRRLADRVAKLKGIHLSLSNNVVDYLLMEGTNIITDTASGGGRAMVRRVEREVFSLVSEVVGRSNEEGLEPYDILISVAGLMQHEEGHGRVDSVAHLQCEFRALELSTGRYYDVVFDGKDSSFKKTVVELDFLDEEGSESV